MLASEVNMMGEKERKAFENNVCHSIFHDTELCFALAVL